VIPLCRLARLPVGRDLDQRQVDAQELAKSFERARQPTEPRWHRRFDGIVVDVAALNAQQPTEIERTKVSAQEVGAERDQRREPRATIFPLAVATVFTGVEVEDDELPFPACLGEP